MHQATFEDYWKQRRRQVMQQWDKLSEHDIDRVAGRYTHLVSVLQEKYGLNAAQAGAEIDRWLQQPLAGNKQRESDRQQTNDLVDSGLQVGASSGEAESGNNN
jgi:hypothetical protein